MTSYRAVLMPLDEKPKQTISSSIEAARAWAVKVLEPGRYVQVFKSEELPHELIEPQPVTPQISGPRSAD